MEVQQNITGISAELKAATGPLWEKATQHPFCNLIGRGTMPERLFRRYLVSDYYFVGYFVEALTHLINKAPTPQAKKKLIHFFNSVTGEENDYFRRALAVYGRSLEEPIEPEECIFNMSAFLLSVAESGTYEEALTAFLACEWIYEEWALIQTQKQDLPKAFQLREWITLHSSPEFVEFVSWLRGELNRSTNGQTLAQRPELEKIFYHVTELEIEFFNVCFATSEF